MPRLSTFLDRFRRVLPPGPAMPAPAVPIDRTAAIEAEVTAVLRDLAAIEAEAQAIERGAAEEAGRLLSSADADAAAMVTTAREQAPRIRASAAKARRAEANRRIAAIGSAARARERRLRARSASTLPDLVAGIVADVRHLGTA